MPPTSHIQDQVVPILVESNLITVEDLERARRASAAGNSATGIVYELVKRGSLKVSDLLPVMAKKFNILTVDLNTVDSPAKDLLELMTPERARSEQAIPLGEQEQTLYVAIADYRNNDPIDLLKYKISGKWPRVAPVLADEYSLEQFIERHYPRDVQDNLSQILESATANVEVVDDIDTAAEVTQREVDDAPIVQLVNSIIQKAIEMKASDIHFEPYEREVLVRYRIDGTLKNITRIPVSQREDIGRKIASRIKVMSKLRSDERRAPQDGNFKVKAVGKLVDMRVSILPTVHGERVALRILDKNAVSFDLDQLGYPMEDQKTIARLLQSPHGIVLATGPTGSGKTTSLYAMLMMLKNEGINILTAEDPVEYDIPGISQVHIDESQKRGWEVTLESFLRQDPDGIMIGEMRSPATARIGVRAALTGHMVLSTLHANDSVNAIVRLDDLGIKRSDVATVVRMVIAQRLVRRLCNTCKVEMAPDKALLKLHGLEVRLEGAKFYKPVGCARCNQTGYKGRVGLYELFVPDAAITDMILSEEKTIAQIRAAAVRDLHMRTLREAGLEKIREGVTTVQEVVDKTAAV